MEEYWSGLSFSSPGDLPNLGIEPTSVSCIGSLSLASPGKPFFYKCFSNIFLHMCLCAYIHVFQIFNNPLGLNISSSFKKLILTELYACETGEKQAGNNHLKIQPFKDTAFEKNRILQKLVRTE